MLTKVARRQRIRELLADNQIFSQEQLQAMLRAKSAHVTQATLSRDLRDLGVVKGPAGYQLVNGGPGQPSAESQSYRAAELHSYAATGNGAGRFTSELERVLPASLLSADVGANLVVLHTQPAHANPLAIEIDRAHL